MFDLASKSVKYFLLFLFAFANAYIISSIFGVSTISQILISPSIWEWLFRIAVFIVCFCGVSIIYESSR